MQEESNMPKLRITLINRSTCLAITAILLTCCVPTRFAAAQPNADAVEATNPKQTNDVDKLIPLNKQKTVLLDVVGKRVLLKTKVVLRAGILEMLVCKKQTKEHESILSVDAQAYEIHAGLAKLGAEPGSPAVFIPKFTPPKGQRIDIFLQWKDAKGKLQRVPAQQWIRYVTRRYYGELLERLPYDVVLAGKSELRYDKKFKELSWYGPMSKADREKSLSLSQDKAFRVAINNFYKRSRPRQFDTHWVFAGSGFTVDEQTGKQTYNAEHGDVICVANFPTSMIDVAVESSSSGEASVLFEPWTERVPPIGTEITVELVPVFKKANKKPAAND
jgi:hypothetical protein